MTAYIQVITTVDSREGAEQLARRLLESRLAACVQIAGPVASSYWWQGKLEQESEYQCLIKSRQDLFARLREAIRAHHPYQVPEILAMPVLAGDPDYLAWLDRELAPE